MPEQTETKPDADKTGETKPDAKTAAASADALAEAERAELSKLTKAELVDRVIGETAERRALALDFHEFRREAADRRRARPEDAMVVSALLDLHRTVEERQGATIRGRSPAIGNRYLEAARALGDELVVAILGPAKG